MKKLQITLLGILISTSTIYAKQNLKKVYSSNLIIIIRDAKAKVIRKEHDIILDQRDIRAKRSNYFSEKNIIKIDPREKENLRRAKKSMNRDKLDKYIKLAYN